MFWSTKKTENQQEIDKLLSDPCVAGTVLHEDKDKDKEFFPSFSLKYFGQLKTQGKIQGKDKLLTDPGVAGADQHLSYSLINDNIPLKSWQHLHTQTVRARNLSFHKFSHFF